MKFLESAGRSSHPAQSQGQTRKSSLALLPRRQRTQRSHRAHLQRRARDSAHLRRWARQWGAAINACSMAAPSTARHIPRIRRMMAVIAPLPEGKAAIVSTVCWLRFDHRRAPATEASRAWTVFCPRGVACPSQVAPEVATARWQVCRSPPRSALLGGSVLVRCA